MSAFPSIITEDHVKQVLARYEAGEQITGVCKDYGVSHVTLYKRIIATSENAWKELQVARSIARKEEAEAELDAATDAITLARGRERLKAAQWDLERVCRRIYGEEKAPQVIINIGNTAGRIADLERELLGAEHKEPITLNHNE